MKIIKDQRSVLAMVTGDYILVWIQIQIWVVVELLFLIMLMHK